ncbi:hypothetical protein PoB_000866000 [Plakobranchus ocellatus]|uniref:Uncharacterized protein n=1 Tax=Plakobranchus ocellatus TaxID=259542 RepID=A0AAV3YHF7_9GAST|nr:hypothetical protein PoB_000866000 [Plakobranchus ocellatus]
MANNKHLIGCVTNSHKSPELPTQAQDNSALKQIVDQGIWVDGPSVPDTFYNGWYPLRRCSFQGHTPAPRLGMSTTKITEFRDYRVVCNICDKDKAHLGNNEGFHDGTKRLYEVKRKMDGVGVGNNHWRYHDPHIWIDQPTLPQSANVHTNNWFKAGIDLDILNQNLLKAERKLERYKKMKSFKERNNTGAAKVAEEMLKEQQKKCSFNNPITYAIPPLPPPPKGKSQNESKKTALKIEPPQEIISAPYMLFD